MPALTVAAARTQFSAELAAAGVDGARLEAEILLAYALQKPRSFLYAHAEAQLSPACAAQLQALVAQRCEGQPVAYLTSQREFWSLPLYVDQRVLIPRAETECLVEAVLELALPGDATVIDLGTGSGAIALALASERPAWCCIASDRLAEPLQVCTENIRRLFADSATSHGPLLLQADWLEACAENCFDLVVSNPPYIAAGDAHLARGDVRFEPPAALASGADGLRDLDCISGQAWRCLKPGGWLAFEHGYNQQQELLAGVAGLGFENCREGCDLSGQPRFIIARKPARQATR